MTFEEGIDLISKYYMEVIDDYDPDDNKVIMSFYQYIGYILCANGRISALFADSLNCLQLR